MAYIANIMIESVINIELIFLVITMLELCRECACSLDMESEMSGVKCHDIWQLLFKML